MGLLSRGLIAAILLTTTVARAEGELNVYNWRASTNPEVIERFAQIYDVSVTIDNFETNQEVLAALRAGNSGYDVVMPSDWTVQLLIEEGLLAETKPNQMKNFKNVDPRWVNVSWDPGRNYSVPGVMGTTGIIVDSAAYRGEIDTLKLLFEPPPELHGRISVVPEGMDVIDAAMRYLKRPLCADDPEDLRALAALLENARHHWKTVTYEIVDSMLGGETVLSYAWSSQAAYIRQNKPTSTYAYPREGFAGWMINLVVPKDAPNLENAKLYQNFMMDPEIAALDSEFNLATNAIIGSERFLPADFLSVPEITLPEGATPEFIPFCPRAVLDQYEEIWTAVTR